MGPKIFWSSTVGFLAGILARSFVPLGFTDALFFVFLACVILFTCYFYNHARLRIEIILVIAVVAFAGGIARMNAGIIHGDQSINTYIGERVTLTGYVFAEPDARENSTRVSIRANKLTSGSSTVSIRAGVLVSLSPHANVLYGDIISVSGTLRIPEAFDTGLGRSFDYPKYLAVSGIAYQLSSAQIDLINGNDGNAIYASVINIKESFINGIGQVLPEPEAGLAGGITVGDKRSIGSELSSDFQRAGLIHMLVLSGYNITVILNAVAYFTKWLPQIAQFGMSGFVVFFFMILSGGASSAMRAGLMALIVVYARQHGRTYLALRAIGLVSLMMVLWNPYIVAFDPSFQLSVLATVGLIIFTPIFAVRMQWLTEKFGLREIISSTLGTQLAVLPFLLYQSGQFSLVALPANVLALIPIPFAMFASCVGALLGVIFGSTVAILALPAYALLSYIITIAHFFGSISFASVSVGSFGVWWLFGAYIFLFWVWWYSTKNKTRT